MSSEHDDGDDGAAGDENIEHEEKQLNDPLSGKPATPNGDPEKRNTQEQRDTQEPSREEFVMLVINSQNRLYAYVLSLVFDRDRAKDILQQTNLVLLEKEVDYKPGTNFFAWAAKVAYYEVLADRRTRQRDRHLFSDELLALVASEAETTSEMSEERIEALRDCLSQFSPSHRDLLMRRYRPGGSVSAIADSLSKTPGAISAILHRLRSSLLDCVQRKLRSLPNS